MRRRLYKSAAAPMLHSGTDRDEFNVVCRFKPNLPNQTDSNAALLPYYSSVRFGTSMEWHLEQACMS